VLYLKPQVCIFVGESSVISKRKKNILSHLLEGRGLSMEISFQCIPYGDMGEATDRLTRLVMEHPDCILDVTGGTEMMIALAGFLAGKFDIPIYQRKGRSGQILWQLNCDLPNETAALTVKEVVALHSGSILGTYPTPDPKGELAKDIPLIWDVSRKNPGAYNSLCNALAQLVEKNASSDPLELVVDGNTYRKAPYIDIDMLQELEKVGILREVNTQWGGITLRFRDGEVKRLLTKAGDLLELATWLAAAHADDRAMGIRLDWDGIEPEDRGEVQTTNELDGMMTFGLIPVCVSCKNGEVKKEALYELDSVSRHFAGRFAQRILVASYVDRSKSTVDTLKRRARDMHIVPLFDVHKYSFEEFARELQKHFPKGKH
jgi:hypothetical protein